MSIGRVVSVVAATLLGAALTAALLGGRLWGGDSAQATDGRSAGLASSAVPRIPSPSSSSTSSVAPSINAHTTSTPTAAADPAAAAPTRVVLPRLGVDMPVEAQGVDGNGQMGLPPDPGVAGWYRFGAAPADGAGAVVVAAHVDSKRLGVGPFVRLGSARAGDEVELWVAGARITYRVSQVARVDKAQLDAQGLFSLSGPPRLHLVTCTGDYVAGSGYAQNLVVVADRVTS
ncbi:MAG: class F sortase [Lapillicoccus sp.]